MKKATMGRWSIWMIALAGCGSSGSQDAGNVEVTTLDGSTPLATLTASQAAQLCTDVVAYEDHLVSASGDCKIASIAAAAALRASSSGSVITDAQYQAACASDYGKCATNGSAVNGTEGCGVGQFQSCVLAATVAEYAACVTDMTTGAAQVASAFPGCSALTADSLPTALAGLSQAVEAPNCTTLSTDCPAVAVRTP